MTQYSIQFSTNADAITRQLARLQSEIANTVINRTNKIKLDLDTASFQRAITASFKSLDKEIANAARKMRELQIGSTGFQAQARISGAAQGQRERGELIARAIGSQQAAKAFDTGSLVRYERVLESLRIKASLISPDTKQWVQLQKRIGSVSAEMQRASKTAESIQLRGSLGAFAPGSLNQFRAQLEILRIRANDIAPNTGEWRKLNKEIQIAERGIKKISAPPLTAGQRAGAAGGAFLYGGGLGGGIGSAVGGIAGGFAGGVPGAFAGAAIGQAVDNMGTALAGVTTQAAAIQQLQRGLAMASVDAKDFAEAQAAVGEMSGRILMPMEQTLRMFTQLRVNTKEYNLSVAETAKIMEGTALAIQATGGSTQDLEGAMRAVVQIMSKGGVQADELRGQLGERFPGAVVKFAKANNMSFEELQDALQAGRVGIAEFVKFAEQNYGDYAQFSQQLATAPEFAGKRLAIAFEQMQIAIGSTMGDAGAIIQDALAGWLKSTADWVNKNKGFLRQFAKDFGDAFKLIIEAAKLAAWAIEKAFMPVFRVLQDLVNNIKIAVGSAGLIEYANKLTALNSQIARLEAQRGGLLPLSPVGEIQLRIAKGERAKIEKEYRARGGDAALAGAQGMTFGGPGAGMSTERKQEEQLTKEKKVNLEGFERLRDQLANAYNRAEIERIRARYEVEKRLRENLFATQEAGANRLQRQNLQLFRALVTAEQQRFETNLDARLNVAQEAGKVDQATSSVAIGKETAGGGAIFGATGRVFNAPGWVHGHFQNQNRDALVQDTVEVVMGLIARGVSPELGSGARFSSKMSTRQIEALVRRGVASHKQYASGIGAVDIFVPAGTQVPTPVSGVQNLGGAAGVTGTLPRGTQLMHLDPRSRGYAGAPRKVGSNEARDTLAAANTEIAKATALETERTSAILKTSDQLRALAEYAQSVYNIPDLILDTQLQKKRNDLIEAGVDENIIDYQIRLHEIELQRQHLLQALPKYIKDANLSEQDRANLQDRLKEALAASQQAEKDKNDETQRGINIQRAKEINYYIKSLREEIALLRAVTEEERARLEIQQQYKYASEEQREQIYNLRETKKNLEEARRLIDDFVTSVTGEYKGFLKTVISGGDVKDALRQFQEGLRDKVLTVFFDFAMKPMEQFFQEQLKGLMNKMIPMSAEEQIKAEAQQSMPQNVANIATNLNTIATQGVMIKGGAPVASLATKGFASFSGGLGREAMEAPFEVDLRSMVEAEEGIRATSESMYQLGATMPALGQGVGQLTRNFAASAVQSGAAAKTWQQSLGTAVQSIGMAAGAVMSIAGGVSQIREGGVSGVLGGIGSIFMGIGGALGGFSGLGGLFGGGGGVSAPNIFSGLPQSSVAMGFAANGAVWKGGFTPFANGGVVNGPTLGLVGEGRYNEAIVPLPDGRSIPVKMAGGQSAREAMQTGGMASAAPSMLSFSFETTNIGGVEYVSRDQLELAMAATRKQAVKEGAKRGMDMTMDKIRNSPASRQSIAMGRR